MPRVRKYKKSSSSREKRFSLGDFLLKLFAVIAAAALALSYISVYLKPSDLSSVLMYFGLYFIPILFVNLIIFIIALVRLKGIAFLSLIVMLPTLFYADAFVNFGSNQKEPEGEPFKMLTYNVGQMRLATDGQNGATANTARIENYLRQESVDILCLQEYSADDRSKYDSFLPEMPYRHQYFFGSKKINGNAILSRYPIVESGYLKFGDSHNMCIWADIDMGGSPVRIYNCHLQSNTISFTNLIQRMVDKGDLGTEVKEVHQKLRGSNKIRAQQVEEILAHSSQCTHPVIICGDFNDTPVSHTYYKLQKGRKDSFAEAGKGFGASYSFLWPLLRIDYILLPKEFSAFKNEIKKEKYSDHYPVSTYIYR